MYAFGFLMVFLLARYRNRKTLNQWETVELIDVVLSGGIGAIIGGRLGYMLFYETSNFFHNPLLILEVSKGGMSFHGGFLGVIFALIHIAHTRKHKFIHVADFFLPTFSIGLGLGRLGNFINMELPGRVTESIFGFYYPCAVVNRLNPLCVEGWETVTRHPSPLYQAFAEGLLLFIIVWWYSSKPRNPGQVSAIFLIGYGFARISTEMFRAPDPQLGFVLFDVVTMGQILSIPMVLSGVWLLLRSRKLSGESQLHIIDSVETK
jgi:phosphatidylglycerol:prolipoprotein diacylglycerol transferase